MYVSKRKTRMIETKNFLAADGYNETIDRPLLASIANSL
ncbi:hypothetical protein MYAER_3372 [Microcystis aeruginosa NIES-2549]|uniref:Uncharacterized protein n=1 Tax=Microcystis aeruginosa NIES-2549 TaxID=1641812 RepID=A0A0F6RMN2_MICAE|nr:hypothetical protein MYAER_3372 [Microcystis aeruginosa NIES-2549]AOC54114.1 hypothetical protein amyaer_3409 [Microcystis aeruginosa NIES-2481]